MFVFVCGEVFILCENSVLSPFFLTGPMSVPAQLWARAHRSLIQLSIFGLSATDKKGIQNTGR